VLSLHDRFGEAMHVDPFNLNPDLLYPIIDATTVKRTRHFIKQHYENDLITLPGGSPLPIRFPRPKASSISYDLDTVLPGFLDRLEKALMPAGAHPELTLARYQPENYPAGHDPVDTDHAIVGLIRSGLLKRFESSVAAALPSPRPAPAPPPRSAACETGQVLPNKVSTTQQPRTCSPDWRQWFRMSGSVQPASRRAPLPDLLG
jgi:hypothetical protein